MTRETQINRGMRPPDIPRDARAVSVI